MLHVAHRGAAEPNRLHHALEVAGHQGDIRCRNRHIRAGTDGNPQVSLGESGCIVDAVTDHRHSLPLGLHLADGFRLLAWQNLSQDAVDPDLTEPWASSTILTICGGGCPGARCLRRAMPGTLGGLHKMSTLCPSALRNSVVA